MVTEERSENIMRNKMIDDPTALRTSVINCFTTVFGPGFTAEENINRPIHANNTYSYDFGYGNLFFRPIFSRNDLYKILHDWYIYAAANVTDKNRQLLYKTSPTYDDYMTACIFIAAVKNGYSIKMKTGPKGFILASTINTRMWWVEKMFVERIPVDLIFFALTRDVVISTETEYEKLRTELTTIPLEWLDKMYSPTTLISY